MNAEVTKTIKLDDFDKYALECLGAHLSDWLHGRTPNPERTAEKIYTRIRDLLYVDTLSSDLLAERVLSAEKKS